MASKILIVGHGSVGKKYSSAFDAAGYDVAVLDPYCSSEKYESYTTWRDVKEKYQNIENFVLSDFAETRFYNFKQALELRPKKLLLEKLISNDHLKLKKIREISSSSDCQIVTHLRWNILKLGLELQKLSLKHSLGEFCSLNVVSGNTCLSVGGAHWLGLYLNLIRETRNIEVQSNIQHKFQSPRSDELMVLSGSIHLYSEMGNLSLEFSEKSRISPVATFLFEGGYVQFSISGALQVFAVENFSQLKPYQYRIPDIMETDQISFPDIFSDIAVNWQSSTLPDVEDGLMVSELMLASLHNNGKKRRCLDDILSSNQSIKFPIT